MQHTSKDQGIIEQVNMPVVLVSGLPTVTMKEVVILDNGQFGWVVGLHDDLVEVFLLSSERVPIGTKVTRTKKPLAIPVGYFLLGKTLPAFFDASFVGATNPPLQELDVPPKRLDTRIQITKPFKTGTTVVDLLIPLGRGQRELIIGDRKIGKTSFILTVIKQQVADGIIPILALIGKKQSEIKTIEHILEDEKIRDKVILVITSSAESPSAIFLTPFTAMAIAEYFAGSGKDTVVILDDLSTHAKFYRELCLIANRFPGRDSYPGDIFYTHARLLERAGNFKHETVGSVAITCLPVVETMQKDFTGYIQTNLMGITDGHILFDSDIFANGQRPAVNISLSVSRAGKQTRSSLSQDIYHLLLSFLVQYEELKNVSHFGTELTENVRATLAKGERLYQFFNQEALVTIPEEIDMMLFALLWNDLLKKDLSLDHVRRLLQTHMSKPHTQQLYQELLTSENFDAMTRRLVAQRQVFEKLWQ